MGSKSRTDVPEQTHESMRAGAMRPINGPAATPVQAASGGNEVPGRERRDANAPTVGADGAAHEPVPGEHDASTTTRRQPGAVGGAFNGDDNVPSEAAAMHERTARERAREGGGGVGERKQKKRGDH